MKYTVYILLHIVLIIGGAYLATLGGNWAALGLSVAAAGVSGLVVLGYIVFDRRKSEKLEVLDEFGLEAAFRYRSTSIREEYTRLLDRASFRIDAMGFGLNSLLQDYGSSFAAWKARASVRILLLDPEYPTEEHSYALQRDREENSDLGSIAREVERFVRKVAPLLDSNFRVRLYRCLPALNIFRVDNRLFFGPYLIGGPSRNQPTFLLRDGGALFKVVLDHFETIWEDPTFSREIPHEWLDDRKGGIPPASRAL